ncbi:MAG: type I DNA topoisomerase [Bacilli bacterium]|nr:type I DNA topoisomerase [Bacilli bacterium]MDD3895495.1 type I DNA topoisomerase [Bacilli bacterium]MDD4407416.1 type I DNA topoisomerase [Bacilli bacterium]
MKLVIVESPSKTKTIEKYLGKDYKVVSSKGHIRDLATTGKYGLGIDIENNFKPNYKPAKGKNAVIKELKKDVLNSNYVYLATDPDREGEAISWHLYDSLELNDEIYERVIFNEITKDAVLKAFKNPIKINNDLVKSQETRRMLDRIIGFRLSKLMQSKTGGKSAGRVQSVALKLIVDREREIEAFIPEEYWNITAQFKDFESILEKYRGKKIKITGEAEANEILNKLSKSFVIENIEQKEKTKKGVMPFTTSTLQQTCANRLNFGSSKTMKIAQKLYESVNIGTETVGLITYMRTDSTRLSPGFIDDTYKYIKKKYGDNYIGYVKTNKSKNKVQDAHEAIRPTSIERTPESIKDYLSNDEYKIYSIIYYRALASLMSDAKTLATTLILENNGYTFKSTGSILTFDGYLKVYGKYVNNEDVILPDFSNYKTNILIANDILPSQHFTKPAARYTESTLIKELEALGIGRPSTYSKIMETIKARDYVSVIDKKFHPTETGIETTDKLQEYFQNIINIEYTANMENDLDKIADNKIDHIKVLTDFYNKFEPLVDKAFAEMEKKAPLLTGEKCPDCNSDLVIRKGRYGEFTACSNYPTCRYIKKEEKEKIIVGKCPECNNDIIQKPTRKGKLFYGCSNYPNCKFALWDKPTGDKCPECSSLMVEKGKIIKCSSCNYKK